MAEQTPEADPPKPGAPKKRAPLAGAGLDHGMSQVSLVESALCPLDYQPGTALNHHSEFIYYDSDRRRRTGTVTVKAPSGLSPTDELVLYGLLAITFADHRPTLELSATPHFFCRQLGLPIGGDHYRRFRESLRRLSEVTYRNSAWWDKARTEHRDVGFHFFSHDLPAEHENGGDDRGREPWTILWDPLFFRLMEQSRGFIWFDFETYRALKNPAARRGFLLLQKIFHHRELTPHFDLRSFAVQQLGYSPELEMKSIRQKVKALVRIWQDLEIVAKTEDTESFFSRKGAGQWGLCLPRGARYDQESSRPRTYTQKISDHPAYEILQGMDLTHEEIAAIFQENHDRMIFVTRVAMMTRTALRQSGDGTAAKQIFLRNLATTANEAADEASDQRTRSLYEQRRSEAREAWIDQAAPAHEVLTATFRFPEFEAWVKGEPEGK